MSPAGQRLWSVVRAAERRVRRDAVVAVAGVMAAVIPVALVVAWVLGGIGGWTAPSVAPLVLEVAALLGAAWIAVGIGRRWAAVDERRIAAAAEVWRGLPPGSVRGVLELSRALPAGTSPALYQRAESELAGVFAGATAVELSGGVGEAARRRRRRALVSLTALTGFALLLGFVSPDRSRAGWAPLLNPVAHLSPPPLPPLVVAPGDAEVPRGGSLDVRVQAPGRSEVVLRWRSAGDVPRQRTLRVDATEAAATQLGAIDAPLVYWVTAPDGAVSDSFRVRPVDPLLVSDLVIDVVYPGYLERQAERFEGDAPPLVIPAGTELRVRGRATQRLDSVALVREDGGSRVDLTVTADRFSGRWTPRSSAVYLWRLTDPAGAEPAATPAPLDITLVVDSVPDVLISFPGQDTVLGPDLRQPLLVDAWDDHGLRAATLLSWRVSALGTRDSTVAQALPLDGSPERVSLRALLDASERRLLPGDTLFYRVRVVDDSPAGQSATSETYRLRLPSMAELRREAEGAASSMVEDASALAESARQLGEATRDLKRRSSGGTARRPTPGASPGGRAGDQGRNRQDMNFQQAEEARQVVDRQQAMIEKVEEMRERVEALERAMEAAGLEDPDLQQRLQELRQLYDEILTPELRKKLAELRESLENLDPEQMQRALEQLAQQQEEFRQRLEQSLELLRRAAVEQQMNALAREAKELSTQQQALAEAMKQEGTPSPERARQQQELADQGKSLTEKLSELQQQLQKQGETQAAEQTGEANKLAQQAQQGMQQAAQQAQQGMQQQGQQQSQQQGQQQGQQAGQQAGETGQQAAQQMEQAANALESARQGMAQAWRQEVQETVQQATQDALSLAERQNELMQRMQQQQQQQRGGQPDAAQMQQMRAEQAALQQGLQALGRNLSEAGQRSAMVNRDVGAALGRSMLSMQQTLDAMDGRDGNRRMPVPEAAQTVDALNRLALSLLANSQQIAQSQSGTGLQEALEQLAELAKQQGAVNGQSSSLMPMDLAPQVMGQQLQQLAREQREIAQKLGGVNDMVGGREDVLGRLDELAREAEQLAREMAGGRLTPELLARQERLFHRLLDAGRTLERDEVTDERVAERPGNVAPSLANPLDPSLVIGGPRFPAPTPEQLRELPPAYRRLILEYFDRLNQTPTPNRTPPRGSSR